jgi:enamine deaminase RidA (YjgF/YER057c/UK114 family)
MFEHIDPEELGPPRGWTNGMLAPAGGRVLFVAGQDAANAEGSVTTDDFVEQFDLALGKTLAVIAAAGGEPSCIGRMTVYVTDLDAYRDTRRELGGVYRARMGKHFPAMALVEVSRLVDPRGKVEIEATAVLPAHAGATTTARAGGSDAEGAAG